MADAQTAAIALEPRLGERVRRLAAARHRTPEGLMADAIEQYVDREERRERFRPDAPTAWQDYRETGLHVTLEEADGWMAQLAVSCQALGKGHAAGDVEPSIQMRDIP